MTEAPYDDDEAVNAANLLEEAAGVLAEGSVTLPEELMEGIRRYARHVIHVLNNIEQDPETDMQELLLSTIANIGASCYVLGATANSDEENQEAEWLPVVLPAGAVIAALRGGAINLRLIIE